MTKARINGEILIDWQALLEAVERHTERAEAGSFAPLDAERLRRASEVVLMRIDEAKRKPAKKNEL